jgi:hypothetical protein
VRLTSKKDSEPRAGAHSEHFYKSKKIEFVILYSENYEDTGEYRVFHVKDTASKVTEERMRNTWYPMDVNGEYFFFRFDEEVNIGRLNISGLIEELKVKHVTEFKTYSPKEPLFCTAEDVLKYRNGF